jgi:hypothetical protein
VVWRRFQIVCGDLKIEKLWAFSDENSNEKPRIIHAKIIKRGGRNHEVYMLTLDPKRNSSCQPLQNNASPFTQNVKTDNGPPLLCKV